MAIIKCSENKGEIRKKSPLENNSEIEAQTNFTC